jgi:hypothetical protein
MGYHQIALTLNAEGVPIPLDIHYAKKGKPNPNRCNHAWSENGIKIIIRNEVYIGNMVNGKSSTLSYKNKKLQYKPKEDWVRVEGTHEAVISREIWDLCAALDKERYIRHEHAEYAPSVLTGLVNCMDCGAKMHIRRNKQTKNGNTHVYTYIDCGSYRKSGITSCSPHSIREEALLSLVLADIREKARAVSLNEAEIVKQIIKLKVCESDSRMAGYEKELHTALTRLPEVERLMMTLYEDRIKGTVPEAVFATLMKKYETQQAELTAQIPALEEKIHAGRQGKDDTRLWISHIKKYAAVEEADEAILIELIERIDVGEPHKADGVTVCDIKVVYRYVGDVDAAVQSAKEAA